MVKKKGKKSLDELLEEALVKEGEEPYEVPGNWVWVRICDNFKLCNEKIVPQNGKALPYIGLEHMVKGGGILSISTTEGVKSAKSVFRKNDILYGKLRPYLDKHTLAESDGVCSTDILVFRNKKHYIPVLLNLYLGLPHVVRSSVESSSGINLPRVSGKIISNFPMPLPPLPEQRRIVKKLSSMLGKLKEARELIQEARDTFEERRAAILNKAFTGKLTKKWRGENPDVEISLKEIEEPKKKPSKIPAKWKWVKLKEIGEIITGTTPSKKRKDFYGDKFPLFKPTDLNEGYYVTQAADNLSELGIRTTRVLPERSVMVTCIGATIGKTGFSRIRGATNQQINSIIAYEEVLPEYIYFTAISPFFQRSILNNASATTLPILNKTRFGNLLFPLTPLPEQKEIVRILDKLLDHENEAKALIDMEEQIDLLEKSILSKAFRGKLGTNDTNDEPAIELLKRSLKEKMNK